MIPSLPRKSGFCCGALGLLALLAAVPLTAHEFTITQAAVYLPGDGSYRIDVSVDVDALALGLDPETDSAVVAAQMDALDAGALEAARERAAEAVRQLTRIEADGRTIDPDTVTFPQEGTPAATAAEIPTVLGTIARLDGRLPGGTQAVGFGASPALKTLHVVFFDAAREEPVRFIVDPGRTSPAYALDAAAPVEQNVYLRYLVLGFEHILPKGLDHILFVVGLFLLSAKLRPLLWQVTAFTVAHSVTLALSMLGVVELPSHIVESLIALSIAYVAIENLFTERLHAWRTALVFGFGLLHGLGFAGVLRELGLPPNDFFPALLSFNAGVELGQLSVVALAFVLAGRFRKSPWYRRAIVLPVSAAIALTGLYWAWERAVG